jgi:hypothetical protein
MRQSSKKSEILMNNPFFAFPKVGVRLLGLPLHRFLGEKFTCVLAQVWAQVGVSSLGH